MVFQGDLALWTSLGWAKKMLASSQKNFASLRLYLTSDLLYEVQYKKCISTWRAGAGVSMRSEGVRHLPDVFVSHGFGGDGNAMMMLL